MSELQRPTPRKNTERVARDERLAKALRDNLLRRKEQKRARTGWQFRNPRRRIGSASRQLERRSPFQ